MASSGPFESIASIGLLRLRDRRAKQLRPSPFIYPLRLLPLAMKPLAAGFFADAVRVRSGALIIAGTWMDVLGVPTVMPFSVLGFVSLVGFLRLHGLGLDLHRRLLRRYSVADGEVGDLLRQEDFLAASVARLEVRHLAST